MPTARRLSLGSLGAGAGDPQTAWVGMRRDVRWAPQAAVGGALSGRRKQAVRPWGAAREPQKELGPKGVQRSPRARACGRRSAGSAQRRAPTGPPTPARARWLDPGNPGSPRLRGASRVWSEAWNGGDGGGRGLDVREAARGRRGRRAPGEGPGRVCARVASRVVA